MTCKLQPLDLSKHQIMQMYFMWALCEVHIYVGKKSVHSDKMCICTRFSHINNMAILRSWALSNR